MKLVREHINEKFIEQSDPIDDMNIGVLNQIKQDLKAAGIPEGSVEITNDGEIYQSRAAFMKRFRSDKLLDIQLKYLSDKKRLFVESIIDLQHISSSHPTVQTGKDPYKLFTEYVKEALDNKISPEDIKKLIKEFGDNDQNKRSVMILSKLTRNKEQKKYDQENNIYAFIGYDEKVPVTINGKKYYEDKFMAEKLVKIDKFNIADLMQVSAMKKRAEIGHHGHVYMLTVPKDFMDEDYYNGIPEENRYIIEKYKKRI